MALVVGVCGLALWAGLSGVELYAEQMSRPIDTGPEQAQAKMVRDVRLLAVASGAFASASAAFLFWYGLRSLRTRSMPPKGSWVVEGQRIRTGPDAVVRAKLLLTASVALCLLGIVAAVMLWRLPGALLAENQSLRLASPASSAVGMPELRLRSSQEYACR